MTTETLYPFAVYGTLRADYGNDHCWRGRAESYGPFIVEGWELITAYDGAAFPYAVAAPGKRITVEIIVPTPGEHAAVAKRLDALEGYPHHYDRSLVDVTIDRGDLTGIVTCWMYHVPADKVEAMLARPGIRHLPTGDWTDYAWPR